MKRFNWLLALSALYLAITAWRSLPGQPPSLLRPPLNEAELGI